MSCAAAVERVRDLIAKAMPAELHTVTVGIGHPGAPEEYELAVSLYVLQIREDTVARLHSGQPRPTAIEALVLVAAHAPPERGGDAIHMLEQVIGVLRTHPRLGPVAAGATAEVALKVDVTLDQMSSLWQALGAPLQPSVLCHLRVFATPAAEE